jgi:hypothetical protein
MSGSKFLGFVLGAAALLVWLPAEAGAQRWLSLEGRGGVVIPAGDLAEVVERGGAFGGGVAVHVHPRVALRVDFDASFTEEGEPEPGVIAPGINLFHRTAGVEVGLIRPNALDVPFTLTTNLGAGTTTFEVEAFVVPSGPQAGDTFAFDERYFTANGGVKFGYELNRYLSLVLSGQAYRTFADEDDTALLELLSDEIERFDATWSFPITAGIRIGL